MSIANVLNPLIHNEDCVDDPNIVDIDNTFRNNNGIVRLNKVRTSHTVYYAEKHLQTLIDLYNEWVGYDEYMILERTEKREGELSYLKKEWIAVKCSKRGNDVYKYDINKKFANFNNLKIDVDKSRGIKHTNALYITLTYDPKRYSMSEAWKNIGDEWNAFLSKLRWIFRDNKTHEPAKISIFRSWEAFKNGYPHIHALLIFKDKKFATFNYKNKSGKKTIRILTKDKNKIGKLWHSFVDVQGCIDVEKAIENVAWYIGKDLTAKNEIVGYKEILTLMAMWYHRKQSFSISGDFFDLIKDISVIKRISLKQIVQSDLLGNKFVVEWKFLGIVGGNVIQIHDNAWCKRYKEKPKWLNSPKWVKDIYDNFWALDDKWLYRKE